MDELHAQRRLVKSTPELWAEVSDEEALARHLEPFGQIRITRRDPERTVAWEGDRASGTVELDPTGWGTRVTVTATPHGEPARWGDTVSWLAPEEEPWPDAAAGAAEVVQEEEEEELAAGVAGSPAAEAEPQPAAGDEPEAEAEPEPEPERRGFWARLFRRGRRKSAEEPQGGAQPPEEPQAAAPEEAEPAAAEEPPVAQNAPGPAPEDGLAAAVPEVEPEVTRVPPVDRDRARRVLAEMLDHLGTAHHRPFSRG